VERIFIAGEWQRLPFSRGRLTIQTRLGQGGMAEVYLAELQGARGFRRRVVAKRVRPDLLARPRFAEMFEREAEVLARLNHPNIVDVIDFIDVDGEPWLLLEHIDGPSVRQLLARHGPLPIDVSRRIIGDAARALAAVHTAVDDAGTVLGLVHRDVSPDNLMVTSSGIVKLLDFGIVKGASSPSLTTVGALKGKLPYMAPEQLNLGPIDGRTDLYALGVCFYELVCGVRPFVAPSDALLMDAVLHQAAGPPTTLRPGARSVEALILWLLEKNRDDRPRSASLLASLVDRRAGGEQALVSLVGPGPTDDDDDDDDEDEDDELERTVASLRPRPGAATETRTPPAPGWWSMVGSLVDDDEVIALDERSGVVSRLQAATPTPPAVATVTLKGPPAKGPPLPSVPSVPSVPSAASPSTMPAPRRRRGGVVAGLAVGVILGGGLVGGVAVAAFRQKDAAAAEDTDVRPGVAIVDTVPDPPPLAAPTAVAPVVAVAAVAPVVPVPVVAQSDQADRPKPRSGRPGRLTVLAVPWAEVFVDGRTVGTTPVEALKVDAGQHRLRLVGPDSAVDREVTVASGKTTTVREAMP
jgi:serine/threonine protein kinase